MEEDRCLHMAEIECCSQQSEPEVRPNNRESLDASETTSYSSSQLQKAKAKGKGVACKRRNPRVPVRRTKANNVAAIGFPLGMSFAAVMAQVLYRRDAAAESISPDHLSSMCSSAIKESLSSVFGDKLDGLATNFEQSFDSTLSTLRLIYESSAPSEGSKLNNVRMEYPSSKLNRGDCSHDIALENGQSGPLSHAYAEMLDQSIRREEVRDNFHMESVTRDLAMHGQSNQMVCFSPTSSGAMINNPVISTFEKSVMEQCRSNELKTIELGLTMKKLKLKETELALGYDLNDLQRSKLAVEVSKTSFKAEKFKTRLEDTRHGELNKKCIDCLIAGLLIMSFSLFMVLLFITMNGLMKPLNCVLQQRNLSLGGLQNQSLGSIQAFMSFGVKFEL
ncbi:LOW QUALITY PROTEIN: protein CPR-5 [Cicer arietinum]|uniref:LOW QUALITY PROTEIN: protein CPR-5 n=1 Tax=Cicer arietinum TaxID=3827 RepID=A0A1S3E918_CICAR|nr:LOW QUALITY PROTEIN: protein CPR-5 [Cicer arietinum]